MQSLEFYIQYKDKQPVVIRTHELIRSTGQWVQVIFVVGELMDAFRLKSALANTPLESLTLHLSVDGPALLPGLCLSEITSGLTDDTPLIIKSENDMQIDTEIAMKEVLGRLHHQISLEEGSQTIFKAQDSMEELIPENGIVKLKIPAVGGVPDLLYSEEIYTAETALGITMPVEKLLKIKHDIIVLLGVSGCGKTRTCYDFCRSQWALYFDCFADSDFLELTRKLRSSSLLIKTDEIQEAFEADSAHLIDCLLVARFFVLNVLKEHNPNLQPFEWLCIQRSRRTKKTFTKLFDTLASLKKSVVMDILRDFQEKLSSVRLIFDESQSMLEVLKGSYRSSNGNCLEISDDGKLQYPRSLFSFFTSYIVRFSGFKSIWCGTHMRIRTMELFYSAAGDKFASFEVFTDFNYLEPDQILDLFKLWLDVDLETNNALLLEISNFIQGRPRFLSSFLVRLAFSSDIRTAYQRFYRDMTTKYPTERALQSSLYFFWSNRVEWTIKPFQSDGTLNTTVHEMILQLCTSALLGNGSLIEISPSLDLVSTGLAMIKRTSGLFGDWYASMVEPIALSAGLNFLADNYQHHIMDHLASPLFSPLGAQYLSPQERGNRMELIIALRFMQGWWKEESLQEFLPAWFDSSAIEKPLGVKDLRFGRNQTDAFLNQLDDPNDQWLLFPPTAAGPDVRYSVFCCYIKTTWTKKSESTIHVLPEDCRKNLETMGSRNWYKSSVDTQSKVKEKCKDKRFIHMRFELPDTAPGMKDSFCSGSLTGTTDHVICVSLDSNFGRIFFGEHFVSQYKDFVNRTINKR